MSALWRCRLEDTKTQAGFFFVKYIRINIFFNTENYIIINSFNYSLVEMTGDNVYIMSLLFFQALAGRTARSLSSTTPS